MSVDMHIRASTSAWGPVNTTINITVIFNAKWVTVSFS